MAPETCVPDVQTLTPAVPVSVSLPQTQTTLPITIQGCPQVRHLQIYDLSLYNLYSTLFCLHLCGECLADIYCDMLIFHDAKSGAVSGELGHSDDWHDGPDGIPRPALPHPPQRSRPNRWSRWCGSSHLANNQFGFSSWVCGH